MKEKERKALAAKVRSLREVEGISQEKLSDICDVSWRTVSNLECGKSTPDLRFVLALAEHFHISLDDLLDLQAAENKSYSRLCKENEVIAKVTQANDDLLDLLIKIIDATISSPLNNKH